MTVLAAQLMAVVDTSQVEDAIATLHAHSMETVAVTTISLVVSLILLLSC